MDSSNQTMVDTPKHNREDQLAKTQASNLLQWSAELCRFLQDMTHIDEIAQNDSIGDKLTVIEWLRRMRANPNLWRLDSAKMSQLEQLLTKAGAVS